MGSMQPASDLIKLRTYVSEKASVCYKDAKEDALVYKHSRQTLMRYFSNVLLIFSQRILQDIVVYTLERGGPDSRENKQFIQKHQMGSAKVIESLLAETGCVSVLENFLAEWEKKNSEIYKKASLAVSRIREGVKIAVKVTANTLDRLSPKKIRPQERPLDRTHESNRNNVIAASYIISAWKEVARKFRRNGRATTLANAAQGWNVLRKKGPPLVSAVQAIQDSVNNPTKREVIDTLKAPILKRQALMDSGVIQGYGKKWLSKAESDASNYNLQKRQGIEPISGAFRW